MSEQRPNRTVGGVHDEFWRHCNAGQFSLQRCRDCTSFQWPPDPRCEFCGSEQLSWEPVSGRGRLVSWATFEHSYYPELPVPWDTILVELAEGPLFISNPSGFSRDDMAAGLEVCVQLIDCHDEHGAYKLPVFAALGDR